MTNNIAVAQSYKIKTASDLKYHVEQAGHESHFFARSTMKFFGDTMRNYGVRKTTIIRSYNNEKTEVFELYRRRSVKHGLRDSAYFDAKTFERVFAKNGE